MPTDLTLYYVYDPMCSWCYAFRSTWKNVESQLGADVQIKYVVGGLAPDSDEPMPLNTQLYIQSQWHKIIESVPGSVFNFDFWKKCQPRRSTYMACRAVILARHNHLEHEMLQAIQDAYYQKAQNPSDSEILCELASQLGLDSKKFLENLNTESTQAELMADINYSRRLGANSFPCLFLQSGSSVKSIPHHYTNADKILAAIYE